MASGKEIADKAPPPGKLKGYSSVGSSGGMEMGEPREMSEGEEEEMEAAEIGPMEEFADAVTARDPREMREALKTFLDICGYVKKHK